MKKLIMIIGVAMISLTSCKKKENIICEDIRTELEYIYLTDSIEFENVKIEHWTKLDEYDCDKRKIKSTNYFNIY